MNLLDYIRKKKTSARTAKERLQIIVAHECLKQNGIDQEGDEFLPMLQKEILDVIRKYVPVDQQAVRIELDQEGDYEVLELNITLPDRSSRN